MAKSDIFTGGGRLYYEKLNADGSYEPLMYFGKTDGISLSTTVEWKEHFDSEGCTQLLDARYPSKSTASISFSTSEVTLEMQNKAFLGDIVSADQVIATAEAVVVAGTLVKEGSIVDIGYFNATVLVVEDVTDLITYVEGTDYTFDAKSGYITIISSANGGSITTGDVLHLTVTAPAIVMNVSATMKQSSLQGRFVVITSSQTGNNYKYTFKNVSVTQEGDFMIKGEEIATISFAGSALVDSADNGVLSDYLDILELDSSAC